MSAQIKIITTVGRHTVEIVADNIKSAIAASSLFGELPSKCPKDNSETVLHYRKVKRKSDGKEFTYYSLRNTGPKPYELQLGEYQTGGGLFAKMGDGWKAVDFGAPADENQSSPADDEMP